MSDEEQEVPQGPVENAWALKVPEFTEKDNPTGENRTQFEQSYLQFKRSERSRITNVTVNHRNA